MTLWLEKSVGRAVPIPGSPGRFFVLPRGTRASARLLREAESTDGEVFLVSPRSLFLSTLIYVGSCHALLAGYRPTLVRF